MIIELKATNLWKDHKLRTDVREMYKLVYDENSMYVLLGELSDYELNMVLNSFGLLIAKHKELRAT